ncbi:25S rRNA (uracil2843-N3)-methyltransferase [Aspergillus mulundensis]|uniref:25S rRNA (Uridine(2843)-N(3))-methyltransferase n=1 Tax=Aspergillus mulundensis TaxID=1810919 RepID=A0A3D8SUF1_9EURO|nr:Uncharacterized protein DSM5745_01659 [Aspergillus mulundensis]RDW89884.1 Uncharacterized protein DSM5745_01659 [Aspergillus mulundensis]
MAPKSNTSRKQSKDTQSRESRKPDKKNAPAPVPRRRVQDQQRRGEQPDSTSAEDKDQARIDISATIPITLQQLLLNVFRFALLSPSTSLDSQGPDEDADAEEQKEKEEPLDIRSLIQTIKSHLYNRDFDSAFADADERLLRAYALRWSAARALGYAGLFKSLLKVLVEDDPDSREGSMLRPAHVVCIGGGAGAEIVALAAAWRNLMDESVISARQKELSDALEGVFVEDKTEVQKDGTTSNTPSQKQYVQQPDSSLGLSITAVDIADWSTVVKRLSLAILSPLVTGSKSHPAPLLPIPPAADDSDTDLSSNLNIDFKRLDVLSLPDPDLASLFHTSPSSSTTNIVTLMFTLNELFSTSMSKATSFLLRTTDLLAAGTILLVVDSPGSYSTLKLNKSTGEQQERQYPMKFLLDHTLLSVAKGKWEKVYSQDSRWWRRDAARLWYEVGEGAGLEDMRYQIHVYRRLE